MVTSKQTSLKSLLESKRGLHLTAYLVNRGDLGDLKSQLSVTLAQANEWIGGAMSKEARQKFLEPVEALLHDAGLLKQISGNVGIFRNKDLFRVLNIPIEIEQSCQVASSFHVKPLLRWLQVNKDFLLLGVQAETVQIYWGSMDSLRLVDSFSSSSSFPDINERIAELTKDSKPKLFVAGEPQPVKSVLQSLRYKNLVRTPVQNAFRKNEVSECCQLVREVLRAEARQALDRALLEFRFAEENNRVSKNIFQISEAVLQGRVRKLIVTDELSIFGRIDPRSGDVVIHPFDLDHEDDCLLDDLAQMVLSQGGEVVVARLDEIPKGRPILAILEDGGARGPLTLFPR